MITVCTAHPLVYNAYEICLYIMYVSVYTYVSTCMFLYIYIYIYI